MSDEIVVPGDYGFGPIRVVHVTSDPVSMVVAFRRRVDGGEDGVDGLVLSPRQAAPLARALYAAAGPAPEAEAFTASGTPPGLYAQIVAEAEADGLMRGFPVAAAPPPLLPPLTAVQRAWVVAMAEAEGVAGLGPRRINWVVWTVWASRRWGRRRAAMLRSLSSAVSHWRLEQGAVGAMPDDDRGRTHAACCATCRWWHALGDGWGECERPDDRCADPACESIVPPTLLRVVVRQGLACGEGCCDAALHTEAGFGCMAWEPRRDSGPQGAPDSARGPDTPVPGLPSRGGPFPAARADVPCGQGDGE